MDKHERICRYLAACPPAIEKQQGSNQTFAVACSLSNGFNLTVQEVYDYLVLYNSRCQPPWNERELMHKAVDADKAQHSKARGHLLGGDAKYGKEDFKCSSFPAKTEAKPAVVIDPATAIEVFLKGFSCSEADIYDASSIKPSDDYAQDGCLLAEHLFKTGEMVNFVTEYKLSDKQKANPIGYGRTVERNALLDEWALGMPQEDCGGWMRMNPTDGQGVADKNITAYRHILLEFDSIPLDLQLNLIARIPLPISCVLTSGGRSIHAWAKADSMDAVSYKDDAGMLLKMLSRFGLDAKNKNQFVERVTELEAQGAAFSKLVVLKHNLGYELTCKVPHPVQPENPPAVVQSELRY